MKRSTQLYDILVYIVLHRPLGVQLYCYALPWGVSVPMLVFCRFWLTFDLLPWIFIMSDVHCHPWITRKVVSYKLFRCGVRWINHLILEWQYILLDCYAGLWGWGLYLIFCLHHSKSHTYTTKSSPKMRVQITATTSLKSLKRSGVKQSSPHPHVTNYFLFRLRPILTILKDSWKSIYNFSI